jgi:hypothetical protein
MGAGFAQHGFEALHFHREEFTASAIEVVVAATGIVVGRRECGLFDHSLVEKLLKVVVQGAGAHAVVAFGLACDFLHDGVAVEVGWGQGQENMEGGRGERERIGTMRRHCRVPIYRNPSHAVKGYLAKTERLLRHSGFLGLALGFW